MERSCQSEMCLREPRPASESVSVAGDCSCVVLTAGQQTSSSSMVKEYYLSPLTSKFLNYLKRYSNIGLG